MANTYTQIYVQVVFAVEGRENLIRPEWKKELHRHFTELVIGQAQQLLAVHSMPDHTHLLLRLKPSMALSDLMSEIKMGATQRINRRRWVPGRFGWQQGYGAFSCTQAQLPEVIRSIENQEDLHARKSFGEEYLELLEQYQVEYDARYLFKPVQ